MTNRALVQALSFYAYELGISNVETNTSLENAKDKDMSESTNTKSSSGMVIAAGIFAVTAIISCGVLMLVGAVRKRKASNSGAGEIVDKEALYEKYGAMLYTVNREHVETLRKAHCLQKLREGEIISTKNVHKQSDEGTSEYAVICERTFSPGHLRIVRVIRSVRVVNS